MSESGMAAARKEAVAASIERIRAIVAGRGVSRAALEAIRAELIALGARKALFPSAGFPLADGGGSRIHLLQEDSDGRFALYMSVGQAGKRTPPHDHTTWAVIAGVAGREHNIFYQRVDDGSVTGRGAVREAGDFMVEPGTGVCLMPDDIHSVRLEDTGKAMMLHMYGLALDRLDGRVAYDMDQGTYAHFPATNIAK